MMCVNYLLLSNIILSNYNSKQLHIIFIENIEKKLLFFACIQDNSRTMVKIRLLYFKLKSNASIQFKNSNMNKTNVVTHHSMHTLYVSQRGKRENEK